MTILFFILGIVAAGIVAILVIAGKLRERDALHRRKMEDMVMGRTGARTKRPEESTNAAASLPSLSPSVMPATSLLTEPVAQPTTNSTLLIKQLERVVSTAKNAHKTMVQAEEDALIRIAERNHLKLTREVERENREPRPRQPGPCTIQITYVDAQGEWTTRNIAPYKSGNTNQKFDAWCDMRQARRTFYFESIRSGMDLRTRARLTAADVFQRVHPGRRVPTDL